VGQVVRRIPANVLPYESDLELKIVGCGDGPAGFNAEATRRGASVTSVDPIYRWKTAELQDRIETTYEEILEETRRNTEEFVWDSIGSVEALGQLRMAAMQDFLGDYESGKAQGRYLDAALPTYPFGDGSFDLALCSHFLFLYTSQLGEAFHRSAVREMCRVATQVRIFPLLQLGGLPSSWVDSVADDLRTSGYDVSIETVQYEFQRGGDQMIRIGPRE